MYTRQTRQKMRTVVYLEEYNLQQEHVQADIKWKVSDLISID